MTIVDDVFAAFETEKFLGIIPPGIGRRIAVQLFRIKSDPESFVFTEGGWAASLYSGKPCHLVQGPGRSAGPDKWLFSGDAAVWGGDTMVRPLRADTDPDDYADALKLREWLASVGATGPEARARCLAGTRAWAKMPDLY